MALCLSDCASVYANIVERSVNRRPSLFLKYSICKLYRYYLTVMPSLKGLKPGNCRRLFPGDKSPRISPRIYIPGDKSPEISHPGMSGTVECGTAKPIDISQQNCTNLIK